MRTIWFYGGEKEEVLTSVAEIVGEALINRNKNVEIIVHSEIQDILGLGLKNTPEDRATFTDRLGFLGNLLHRNDVFVLMISKDAFLDDRKQVKENYGSYIQATFGKNDPLTDIAIDPEADIATGAKKIVEYLIKKTLIPEQCQEVYSEEEEEEIRKRLEDLGYV